MPSLARNEMLMVYVAFRKRFYSRDARNVVAHCQSASSIRSNPSLETYIRKYVLEYFAEVSTPRLN
jgi:hypothetical protein